MLLQAIELNLHLLVESGALRKEDDALKRQIRKERNAKTKLELQENEAKIAKQLRNKQRQLFDMEDECADKVDALTVKLRKAMTNHYESSVFFRFRWHIQEARKDNL